MAQRGEDYRERLANLTDDQWKTAVDRCLDDLDWFPSIHEILERVPPFVPPPRPMLTDGDGPLVSMEEGLAIFRRELAALGVSDPTAGERAIRKAIGVVRERGTNETFTKATEEE